MPVTVDQAETYTKTWTITWALEFDINDKTTDLQSHLLDLGVSGEWRLRFKRVKEAGESFEVFLAWTGAIPGSLGGPFAARSECTLAAVLPGGGSTNIASFSYVDPDMAPLWPGGEMCVKRIRSKDFRKAASAEYRPDTHQAYQITMILTSTDASAQADRQALPVARQLGGLADGRMISDVRLFFPNLSEEGLELWAKSTVLADASPYFKTLLESGFLEGTKTHSKRRRTETLSTNAGAAAGRDELSFEDSDDEADEVYLARQPNLDYVELEDFEYREVQIVNTAFSTYRAVLVWLLTSYIHFAPLTSTTHPVVNASPKKNLTRYRYLLEYSENEPKLPLPVSPKSVYRLAHLLELSNLQTLALCNLKSQLTKENVALELFGDVSGCYDEVRAIELDLAAKEWAFVKTSPAMAGVSQKVREGGYPHFAEIMVQLLPRT